MDTNGLPNSALPTGYGYSADDPWKTNLYNLKYVKHKKASVKKKNKNKEI